MSFAHKTKSQLVSQSQAMKHDCCRKAELYGILWAAGVFTRQKCKLVTTSEETANLTVKWLSQFCHTEANLYITERKTGDIEERRACKITVSQKSELERLFRIFHYPPKVSETEIMREMFRCSECQAAFVRGVFLSSGTITNPDKSYHLEMSLPSEESAERLSELLTECELENKRMVRKNENVIYFKDNEGISNFLFYIDAKSAAFIMINKKIERGLRGEANRIANSELANIGKTVAAAGDQLSAIRALIESGEIERMPDELKQTAMLRLENESATLSQLAELHNPPITKSGVNHRLKKIQEWNQH